MWIEASAPSNIALIKYMGKTDVTHNKPTNISFSYTLNDLRTYVRLNSHSQMGEDQWSPYKRKDLLDIQLSEKGRLKFLNHFRFLKEEFGLKGFFEIESANNFPSDCGLASSASSFAALTLATYKWAQEMTGINYSQEQLAELSKRGSGSSCRSFFSPWSVWGKEGAHEISLPYKNLKHMVILCDEKRKTVSSSEAHQRVLTSDLFPGRIERVEKRFSELIKALNDKNWRMAFEISWNEFWDMHVLFHTSSSPFMYINNGAQSVLNQILNLWNLSGDGPLVTMDAGSNIHLLFREDQLDIYSQYESIFSPQFNLWTLLGYKKHGT